VEKDKSSCVFCRILAGELPVSMVYDDETVAAFMDIRPVNPGHTLVIPKTHAPYLCDVNPDLGAELFRTGMRVAAALRRTALRCEGVNLFLADGEAAMQEVFHVHLHVIPRFAGDGFGLKFAPHYFQPTSRDSLNAARDAIVAQWQ
jgi:histidine triad (HIT) family protein